MDLLQAWVTWCIPGTQSATQYSLLGCDSQLYNQVLNCIKPRNLPQGRALMCFLKFHFQISQINFPYGPQIRQLPIAMTENPRLSFGTHMSKIQRSRAVIFLNSNDWKLGQPKSLQYIWNLFEHQFLNTTKEMTGPSFFNNVTINASHFEDNQDLRLWITLYFSFFFPSKALSDTSLQSDHPPCVSTWPHQYSRCRNLSEGRSSATAFLW